MKVREPWFLTYTSADVGRTILIMSKDLWKADWLQYRARGYMKGENERSRQEVKIIWTKGGGGIPALMISSANIWKPLCVLTEVDKSLQSMLEIVQHQRAGDSHYKVVKRQKVYKQSTCLQSHCVRMYVTYDPFNQKIGWISGQKNTRQFGFRQGQSTVHTVLQNDRGSSQIPISKVTCHIYEQLKGLWTNQCK